MAAAVYRDEERSAILCDLRVKWCNRGMMKEIRRGGRKAYATDLTDAQWSEIEPLYSGMRKRKWSKQELTNAVLYIVKIGCQWRQLPHDFPPYQTVYSFFSRGAKSGLWEKVLAQLVEKTRKDAEKNKRAKTSYCCRHAGQFAGCGSSCRQYT